METLNSNEILKNKILENPICILYISSDKCIVCRTLKPKIKEVTAKYENISLYFVNIEENPDISGEYSVFSVPTIIVFVDGKESFRESRNMSLYEFEQKIDRYYNLIFN